MLENSNDSYTEADLSKVKRFSVKDRFSKVSTSAFAKPIKADGSWSGFYQSLPDVLLAGQFKKLVENMKLAKAKGKPILWMMGGHVIKVGLGPILIQMMEEGWMQGLVMNSAASIHDSEIARFGQTSEDVSEAIKDGSFGMAYETSVEYLNALNKGIPTGIGWGECMKAWLSDEVHLHKGLSVIAQAQHLNIPLMVFGALGTDIIWQHPELDGAIIGEAGARDFRKLIEFLKGLEGGVVLNWGSAVIIPEVFLKAFTTARNLGAVIEKFSSANFDMIQHYRPRMNILDRPTSLGGEKFAITGHHELMMPLLCAALLEA